MNRALAAPRGAVTAIRERLSAVTGQSERTLMLGTILLASAVSAATGYLLTQCFSVDVLSSLLYIPEDCWLDWGINIGRHCFSDYAMLADVGTRPDPWVVPIAVPWDNYSLTIGYPPALLPPLVFALPAKWLGVPRLGLVLYLLALTIAVLSPAIWAGRGARPLERVGIFMALGAVAIPAWAVIDRGNTAGFLVPIALVFFVALCRQRWGLVTVMVILATLIKPQFFVLGVALLAVRQWRFFGLAVAGVTVSNLAAFLLWPRDFPQTIMRAVSNTLHANSFFPGLVTSRNVSFSKAFLLIPDTLKFAQTGKIPDGYLAAPRSLIGYVILIVVVVAVVALGHRIPPVMVGIVLLATTALFPPEASSYYLVFALPVAALIVRDPDGPPGAGIFDQFAARGDPRRAAGICVGLAAALSISQIALPSQPVHMPVFVQLGVMGEVGTRVVVPTTVGLTPILWLVACAVIIVSYARRPAHSSDSDQPAEIPSDVTV